MDDGGIAGLKANAEKSAVARNFKSFTQKIEKKLSAIRSGNFSGPGDAPSNPLASQAAAGSGAEALIAASRKARAA